MVLNAEALAVLAFRAVQLELQLIRRAGRKVDGRRVERRGTRRGLALVLVVAGTLVAVAR